jgi:CBS domain containing-hemolysin-like protein
MNVAVGLGAVIALILVNAFFVAMEFALVAVDRTRLEMAAEGGSRAAGVAMQLLRSLSFNLSGAQLGITISSLGLGVLAGPVIGSLLEEPLGAVVPDAAAVGLSVALALAVTTVAQMVAGELVPKAVAVARPMPTVLRLSGSFRAFVVLFRPIIAVCDASANALLRLVGIQPTEELDSVRSRDELRRLVRTSSEVGTIERHEALLLDRAFRFGDKEVADALTPRVAVHAVSADASVGDLLDLSELTGLSRFPVHGDDPDQIVGAVHVKDALAIPRPLRREAALAPLVREVPMVPEGKPLDELMDDLKGGSAHLAVVLDEYGVTAGIITMEDVVEEIVGDIVDEHDREAAEPPVRTWKGAHLLSGRLHRDEVAESCGLVVPEGHYETLAGFVLDRLGRIPVEGDGFDHEGWHLEVQQMVGHRVSVVRVVAPAGGVAHGGVGRGGAAVRGTAAPDGSGSGR